ncbi:MAG: YwaF family protein [Oscillospiraceae bacterium]|nr:YwaF family protein [Oscillospiraceae bacterium]
MRDLFLKLFEMSHFDTGISITPFSIAHIVYLVLIFGSIVVGWLTFRNKTAEKKEKLLRFLAYALVTSYISDFFVHEFVYGGLNTDKLPFHICTVLCPLVCFAQFNRNGHKFKEPIVILSVLAPMMYLCFPASVGDGEPWCYQAVQTMFFHGVLMAWGILNIALGEIKPDIQKCWQSGAVLVGITLWAKLGNVLMEHNWFFLEEDAFYIGLVEGGIIPKWSLMIINPIVFFLAVLAVYGVCYAVRAATKKKSLAV